MASRAPANKQVKVIGAGVAGLTVAHELAERGYRVIVWEKTEDPKGFGSPAVGGMARTQWARVTSLAYGEATAARFELNLAETDIKGNMNRTLNCVSLQDPEYKYCLPPRMLSPWPELYFAKGSADLATSPTPGGLSPAQRLVPIADWLADHLRLLAQWDAEQSFPTLPRRKPLDTIWIRGTKSFDESYALFSAPGVALGVPTWPEEIDENRATNVTAMLLCLLFRNLGVGWTVVPAFDPSVIRQILYIFSPGSRTILALRRAGVGTVHDLDRVRTLEQERYVQIALEDNYVAGEHGFRLFPRFYRHLRDTMRRTPILRACALTSAEYAARTAAIGESLEPVDDIDWEITARTAHDNLVPVVEHGFASAGGDRPVRLPRFRGDSLADLFRTLDVLQKQLGWSNRDLTLAQLKVAEYVTSGSARRTTYESMSWWQYVTGNNEKKFSECFKDSLERWPQALIGLGAIDIDARTFGSTMIQQFADQLAPMGYRDGVLNGPTSSAWLEPWRIYLEHLGVHFGRGELARLRLVLGSDGTQYLAPFFKGESVTNPEYRESPGDEHIPDESYLVLALPVERTWQVARGLHQWFTGDADAYEAWIACKPWRIKRLVVEDKRAVRYLLAGQFSELVNHLCRRRRWAALRAIQERDFQRLRSLLERHDEAAELVAAIDWPRLRPVLDLVAANNWWNAGVLLERDGQARQEFEQWCKLGQVLRGNEQALLEFEGSDLRNVLDMLDLKPGTLEGIYHPEQLDKPDLAQSPQPPLKKFAGVQYFFEEDFRFFPGHMYYPDSPWRLTSVSQMQFRQDLAAERSTNRGLVSVVIGTWNAAGGEYSGGKTAWECNDREIAEECWRQIVECFGSEKPPTPLWYHVDRSIALEPRSGRRRNRAPYLTTTTGRFRSWPGRPGHYKLSFNSVCLAGSFMQTHTRLVTMESANEAARHAVNAILDHWASDPAHGTYVGSRAEIWNPEDEEIPNLELLRRIDDRLLDEGLPHSFEILGLESLIADPNSDGHPLTLSEALARVGLSQGRAVSAFVDSLRRAISQMGGSL